MATAKVKKVSEAKIIKLMQSENYKDRFKAEYYQLKNRWEKLSDILEYYKTTGKFFDSHGVEIKNDKIDIPLLTRQKRCMTEYLHILEKRAEIEKIKL